MNQLSHDLAKLYVIDRNMFNQEASRYFPQDSGKVAFESMINSMLTDTNFSALAESIPMAMYGYNHNRKKHGYDGFKGSDYDTSESYAEAKPQKKLSIDSRKLNGGGGFSAYSFDRYHRDIEQGDKLKLVISGWIDGKLIYAYVLPHNYEPFMNHLLKKLNDKNESTSGGLKGVITTPSFSYYNYKDSKDVELIYINPNFDDYLTHMSRPFVKFIKSIKRTIFRSSTSRYGYENGRFADAYGRLNDDGTFTVFSEGSFCKNVSEGFCQPVRRKYYNTRESMIKSNKLIDIDNSYYKLTEDYTFSSPSTAASVIKGTGINGHINWKDVWGNSLVTHLQKTLD